MRNKLLLAASLAAPLAVVAGQACASDLPSAKAPPPPIFTAAPPAFSWTGLYAGIEGGADMMNARGLLNNNGATASYRDRSTAGLLGGMVGYNKQLGMLVLGVEANGDGALGGKRTIAPVDSAGNAYSLASTHTYDADVRGRVGVAIDRALLFAAGGVAFGNTGANFSSAALAAPGSFSNDRVGWTVGGGVEYAFTNNVIGRAEYRFTDLGAANYTNATTGVSDKAKFESNAALLGVMYKFGSP